ncbi:hypothetical protein C8J56DRAFT_213096 [Mycena floridula]|nr:hypothetical protein C8J56DRAFT_213096 [Mycena floridula]
MQPRSILKSRPARLQSSSPSPSSSFIQQHVVHFPSSPNLFQTFEVPSSSAYDRTPIVIGPNSVALPARGCPGRTYYNVDDEEPDEQRFCSRFLKNLEARVLSSSRGHAHPRALDPRNDESIPPPLIPDLSSEESEESDGFISPPPESAFSFIPINTADQCDVSYLSSALEQPLYPEQIKSLPIPVPSPHSEPQALACAAQLSRPRRPRGRLIRKNSSEEIEEDSGYVEDIEAVKLALNRSPSHSPPGSKKKGTRKTSFVCKTLSSLSFCPDEDAGCLGGF